MLYVIRLWYIVYNVHVYKKQNNLNLDLQKNSQSVGAGLID